MDKRKYKNFCIFLATASLFVLFVIHFEKVIGLLGNFFSILAPFTIGIIVAYIVNMPYAWLYQTAFGFLGTGNDFKGKLRKPLSLILAFLFFIAIIAFTICIIVPELSESFNSLSTNMDDYIAKTSSLIQKGLSFIGYQYTDTSDLLKPLNDLSEFLMGHNISDVFKSLSPHIFGITKNITTSLYNIFIGIIISIYFLAYKETLLRQFKKVLCAFLRERHLKYTFKVGRTANEIIGRFICGKVIDSSIIGVLCFIGLSIFGFDYAGLISIVVGITNVIPFFGPIIGAIPCAILLLLVNPIQAFWFIPFILLLQQLDGNVIGPKILGESIGIDGIWIIVGVLLGGGLFGFYGMILGVPILAVIYIFLREHIHATLKKKNYTINPHTIDLNGEIIRTSHEEKQPRFAGIFSGKNKLSNTKGLDDE